MVRASSQPGGENQEPSAPGAISSDESVNKDGTFTLSWGAATDPDASDSVTYTLEHKDSDDADWSSTFGSATSPGSGGFSSGAAGAGGNPGQL